MTPTQARWTSFLVGFLSLSVELLWIRLAGFQFNSRPQAFSLVLGAFLTGIALGALLGRQFCKNGPPLRTTIGISLLASAMVDLTMPWLIAGVSGTPNQISVLIISIMLSSATKAVCFPLVHELGTSASLQTSGRSFSYVYLHNIIGAFAGPILTGYLLLQILSTQQAFHGLASTTLTLSAWCLFPVVSRPAGFIGIGLGSLLLWMTAQVPNQLLAATVQTAPDEHLIQMIENRHGVVHATSSTSGSLKVYGGNVYDGAFNVDLSDRANRIERAYFIAAVHPKPLDVLVIGLSSGSWLSVLTQRQDINSIDVVEINPAYLDLLDRQPIQRSAISDPRVSVYIDDGRRWLKRERNRRYDLVVMNTSYHWRANATAVLSKEFFTLVRSRLKDDGYVYFNTTGSIDTAHTAHSVFPHIFLYQNFALASITPVDLDAASMKDRLQRFLITIPRLGAPPSTRRLQASEIEVVVATPAKTLREWLGTAGRLPEIITDANMISEYRYGIGLSGPHP